MSKSELIKKLDEMRKQMNLETIEDLDKAATLVDSAPFVVSTFVVVATKASAAAAAKNVQPAPRRRYARIRL